eukprot:3417561-Prymnesium_polylepis.1
MTLGVERDGVGQLETCNLADAIIAARLPAAGERAHLSRIDVHHPHLPQNTRMTTNGRTRSRAETPRTRTDEVWGPHFGRVAWRRARCAHRVVVGIAHKELAASDREGESSRSPEGGREPAAGGVGM